MSPRLPIPGSDDDTWGNVLNDFLSVELNADGTLKKSSQITAALPSTGGTVTGDISFPSTGMLMSDGTNQWRLTMSTNGFLIATRLSDNYSVQIGASMSRYITQGLG